MVLIEFNFQITSLKIYYIKKYKYILIVLMVPIEYNFEITSVKID
jgi:hypothetical protein